MLKKSLEKICEKYGGKPYKRNNSKALAGRCLEVFSASSLFNFFHNLDILKHQTEKIKK